jgi:tricorn protease interacting factor F2/3
MLRTVGDRRYELGLEFTDGSLEVQGRVTLREDVLSPHLELDASGLTIRSVDSAGASVTFELDASHDQLRLDGIPPGAREVTIAYTATIDDQTATGLYRSPLGDSVLLTTHLHPIAARRLFPCRDRPEAKAIFSLDVVAPRGLTAISNMPSLSVKEIADGRKRTRFVPTPPMSTYLLYLGVGPLEELERTLHGYRVIAATARGLSSKSEFPVEVAARGLHYFSEYYRLPFPLPKLHLVAVPRFTVGAMENWGAITFGESTLLIDDRTSMRSRQSSCTTVLHEVAHQWFGDLVTMGSWNDLWLSEGFASVLAYKARSELFPDWKSWDEFLTVHYAEAMLFDSLPSTHPIQVEVTDPSRAGEFFDEISYGKGASVLRMLESYVGEESFRQGVASYLREHREGCAEASDLWRALARSSNEPIERVMSEWVRRPGVPVVLARWDDGSVRLEQQRFSLKGSARDSPWPIPLTYDVDGQIGRQLMTETETSLPAGRTSKVIIGPGRTGFYRVRYEGQLRARLLESYGELSAADRWGLLDDSFAFLLSGEIGLPEYLDLLSRVGEEHDALVVNQALGTLAWTYPIVHRVPRFETAFRKIFTDQAERLGLAARSGEAPSETALRQGVLSARVVLDPSFARSLAHRYEELPTLEPEVTGPGFMAYATTGGEAQYAELRQRLKEAPPGPAARALATGLALVNRDTWLGECLDLLGTGELQRSEWLSLIGTAMEFNPDRSAALWSFLTQRLESNLPKLSSGSWGVGSLLQIAIPQVGLTRPDEMRQWVGGHPFPEGEIGAKKGLELLDVFVATFDRIR